MRQLIERIRTDAVYIGNGIVKVDGFLNHQVDSGLLTAIGETFAHRFAEIGIVNIDKIVTAESSGILPALTTGQVLGVPMIYARKHDSATMTDDYYRAQAVSRTKGNRVNLAVSSRYMLPENRVLLIDDFLASGSTLLALIDIIQQSGATLCGIGCVIEKPTEQGRERLAHLNIPILSLAKIDWRDDAVIAYE